MVLRLHDLCCEKRMTWFSIDTLCLQCLKDNVTSFSHFKRPLHNTTFEHFQGRLMLLFFL